MATHFRAIFLVIIMTSLFVGCSPHSGHDPSSWSIDLLGNSGPTDSGNTSNGNHETGDVHCRQPSTVGRTLSPTELTDLGNRCLAYYPSFLCNHHAANCCPSGGRECLLKMFGSLYRTARENDSGQLIIDVPPRAGSQVSHFFLNPDCSLFMDDRCPGQNHPYWLRPSQFERFENER